MPDLRLTTYKDHADLMDTMEMTIAATKAFGSLLELSLRADDSLRKDGYGIWLLLANQCDDLEAIATALRREYHELRASKLKIRNPERIAEWAGTTQYVVNRVISIATGVDLGPPTARHTEQPPYVLKESLGRANAQ